MQDGKPEKVNSVLNWIFDPRNNNRHISVKLKKAYQLHRLIDNWAEVAGANLSKNSSPTRLDRGELTVTTASSSLASELFMMQELLVEKINKFFAGSVVIKKVRFMTGNIVEDGQITRESDYVAGELGFKIAKCPVCGARIKENLNLCYACERERDERKRKELYELLNIQPWLTYAEARTYLDCDSILFKEVQDRLKNYYYEKVRLNDATEAEKNMAVMLLTGKGPEAISQTQRDNALVHLKGVRNVSASRVGLHGKKQ